LTSVINLKSILLKLPLMLGLLCTKNVGLNFGGIRIFRNLKIEKERAINTHKLLVGLGKPRSGPIFLERNQAK